MPRSIALFVAAVAVTIALIITGPSGAAPQGAASPFAGKIALVLLGGEGRHAYLIESRVEELGGKSFLVGQAIDPISGKPLKGTNSWLSIEHVLRITVFDSQEALAEQMKQQEQR